MEWVCFVKNENAKKAENALRLDFDIAAKQSITVRSGDALGVKKGGSFFLVEGTDEGVARCKDMIKDFVEKATKEELESAKQKIVEEREKAACGFGGIFG